MKPKIIAVCGKGGVGKTVVSALLGKVLIDEGVTPVLLVDADPVAGLVTALEASPRLTLGHLRDEAISTLRQGEEEKRSLPTRLDYRLLEALEDRGAYSLLAMGRSASKGCFCPVHALLRRAVKTLAAPFRAVVIDAEAGVEQIQREVTSHVSHVVVVVDSSKRALDALELIEQMVGPGPSLHVVQNRGRPGRDHVSPEPCACFPEDSALGDLDAAGTTLWSLDPERPVWKEARRLARALDLVRGDH